jgi:hypoxanthine-DNA glycosylase
MIETHPFKPFVPHGAKYLILGSFIALKRPKDLFYDWYYGSKRNQFWKILEKVYNLRLPDKKTKQKLFSELKVAITDIICKCERKAENSLDTSLVNCTYNFGVISKLLKENHIEKVFFTSRFVEKEFKKHFKNLISKYPKIKLITLPSPSPRYAKLKVEEKGQRFSKALPKRKL